jgi:hypothetical protein
MYRDNQKVESTPSVTRYFPVRPNSFLCVSLPFSLNLLFSFCYFGGGGLHGAGMGREGEGSRFGRPGRDGSGLGILAHRFENLRRGEG